MSLPVTTFTKHLCGAGLVWALLAALPGMAQYQLPPGTQMPDGTPPAHAAQPASNAAALEPAENKMQQGDYPGARPLVEKYLEAHPADARGLFDLGYLNQAADHVDLAIEDYRKAIAADPKQFEARLALGMILAQQGKDDEARQQLRQATQLTPSTPNPTAQAQADRALAELDLASDPVEAKQSLISALRISPETPDDLLLTAKIAEANEDADSAETAYRRLLAGAPSPALAADATAGLAHLLLQQKKYSDAETLLREALSRSPEDAALNAQLATALIGEDKNSEALPVLEKLRLLKPGNLSVDQMLADAYAQMGQPEKADPLYAEMLKAEPNDPDTLTADGRNLLIEQNFDEAQRVLEEAVKAKPDDGEAWAALAFAANKNRQYTAALHALSMRAKYLPETPSSYFLWAISYDNVHQSKSAEDYYRKFLAADQGKLPDQEWQAKQRLAVLGRSR
ncbi:MAG TPA: tetratricopeptide repeat protein [Acidobacteriaceae bacterium]|nr:tetratricopeptide repeat protein [Acidobacteriaceae bacterium]